MTYLETISSILFKRSSGSIGLYTKPLIPQRSMLFLTSTKTDADNANIGISLLNFLISVAAV